MGEREGGVRTNTETGEEGLGRGVLELLCAELYVFIFMIT